MNKVTSGPINLQDKRILLVEDNFLVGTSIKMMLEQIGCEVVGPLPSLEEGNAAADDLTLDAAVLDINILGGTSIPIAEKLIARRCPVLFVTGYSAPKMLPPTLLNTPRLGKPLDEHMLKNALESGLN